MTPLPSVGGVTERLPAVFARRTGGKGEVRVYNALAAPVAEFCMIPTDSRIALPNTKTSPSYTGYGRGSATKMTRVDSGAISLMGVGFLACDFMQTLGVYVERGRNLPRETRLGRDITSGRFRLERVGAAP